ncbi:MAG: hypothetical protein OEW58_04925 [Gammaproteobacteria bacterium]|nr:hypothetical protein [Gammaproteobacteria bacterium]
MIEFVQIGVEFYCKGERFALSSKVGLDHFMASEPPYNFHDLLAEQHNIVPGTEEYGVLRTAKIEFSELDDEARQFVVDGELDVDRWIQHLRVEQELEALLEAAKFHLGAEDLVEHKEQLKQMLLSAHDKDRR